MKVFTMRLAKDGNIRRAFRSWNVADYLCGSSVEIQRPQVTAKKEITAPLFEICQYEIF